MKTGELFIYDAIGAAFNGITPKDIADSLRSMGPVDQINVRINSPGGDVFDGHTIYKQLRRHPAKKRVDVDGGACSIASVVAMCADPGQLYMAENAWMMIHEPWTKLTGTAAEFRCRADLLEKMGVQIVDLYASRSGVSADEIRGMFAQGEYWMNSREAVAAGLADRITSDLAIAAHIAGDWLGDVPEMIRQRNLAIVDRETKAKEARVLLDKTL